MARNDPFVHTILLTKKKLSKINYSVFMGSLHFHSQNGHFHCTEPCTLAQTPQNAPLWLLNDPFVHTILLRKKNSQKLITLSYGAVCFFTLKTAIFTVQNLALWLKPLKTPPSGS